MVTEAFRSGEIDFRAVLGKIKDSNPEIIFCPTDMTAGAMIMKQARDLGMTAQFVGGDSWSTPDLVSLAGSASEGCYFINITSYEDPIIKGWIDEYVAKFGASPILPNPVWATDALQMVVKAIEQANSAEPAKIIEQLEKIQDLPVLTGKVTIDPKTHDPLNKPATIENVKDGKITYFKRFDKLD